MVAEETLSVKGDRTEKVTRQVRLGSAIFASLAGLVSFP
jgi:hypothetical protein